MAQKIVSYSGEVLKPYTGGGSSEGSSGYSGEQRIVSYSGETLSPYSSGSSLYKYAESLEQDTNQFIRMANRDNSGDRRFNAAEYFEERKKQADALKLRAADLSRQMETDANYNPESYQPLIDYLSNFDTMVDDVLSSYNPSLESREDMRAYEDEFIAAQERNEQLKGLNRQVMFGADPSSPGYGMLERFYQYDTDNSYRSVTDNWTDEERYTLGLLQKEDPVKASDYATQVNNYYNAKYTEDARKNIRQNAVENKGKSTAAALMASTFTAPGELMDRLAENMARGTTTEKRYVSPTDYAQEITGAISEDLNQKHGTFDADEARRIRAELQNNVQGLVDNTGSGMNVAAGKTGEFVYDMLDDKGRGDLYQVGYSIAQNALSRYTLGAMGGEAAVLANYFMNAATSGIDDARRAGASGNQAMLSGIVKGALEVATEVAPLDRLFKMGDAVTWGELFKNLGMEALLEAIGEGANTALGYLADQKILGDSSEYNRMVQEYVNQGMTEAQAKQRAFRDAAMNTAYDALTGAVSGIVSGGTETVGKTAQANLAYRNVDPRTLVDMGMGTSEGSKAYTMAQQMQERLDNDQKISGNQKRVLAQNIQLQKPAQEKAETETRETASTFSRATEQPKVSKDGRAIQISTDNPVDVLDFASMDNGVATVQLNDGETAAYDDIAFKDQQQANQFYAVRSLPGLDTETANNLLHTIQDADAGKDIDSVVGIREAYAMGYYNQSESDLAKGDTAALTPELRKAVFDVGRQQNQVQQNIQSKAKTVTAKPTQGYKKITIEGKITKLDKKRKAEMAYVDSIADNFAGTAVHVYESYVGADGKRYFRDNNGVKHKAPNGKYVNGEIWLDINSGDNGEGMMLNTFAHEMYHHIEKFNKEKANELASFVSRELGIKNVEAAVQDQITKARAAGYGEDYFKKQGMTDIQATNEVYSRAMSDFVADSLETMFTRGNPAEAISKLKTENRGLFDEIKAFIDKWVSKLKKFYQDKTISMEGEMVSQLKNFEELQQLFMEAMQGAGENYKAALEAQPAVAGAEMSNEEAFQDSATAVHFQIRPPYADGSKAFNNFVDGLNPEARKTFDLFYGFYQRSRITNTVSVSGRKVKAVNISSLYLLAQDWNDMLAKEPKWAAAAKDLADFLPADVRKRMNMNADGTLNPTTMEKEFKMPSSMAQRLVDALPFESIDAAYKLGGKTVTLPDGKARQSVGGEAYRRAILDETRKMFSEGKLKPVGIGTMSKDRWGSLGFLAANGKTGASGDFTTVCPQMMFNRGCWYCYRRAAMEKGVNNKLVANNVWYTGEILRIKDSDIAALNKNGGLRIQSFGDWMPHFSAMLADVLYDAELRGLQVKIITKEPSMINYIAALRDQGIGKNLYFNLSADYTIERGPAKQAQGGDSLDTVNPERPYMRDADNTFWWKRAMTVEEAAKYREKYPWVNTRIVATDVAEFIRGLKDNRVDVVTGYHGNIRGIERIDSTTGARKIEVEALGDAGMPRFAFNPSTGTWFTEYEGKTATHKRLAQAIADNGLQWEYYIKTCCITGRCATCEGKCGALARDFNVKNATNRDTQSVAYWQTQMEYAVEPEFWDLTEAFSLRNEKPLTDRDILSQIDPSKRNETERYFLELYQDRLKQISEEEPRLEAIKKQMESLDPKKDKEKLADLGVESRKIQRNITSLKKKVREAEGFDMFKRMVKEERNNRSVQKYKEEQKQKIKDMQMEQRVLREELTGKKSDISIMEREFIRIAKQYEKLDAKTGKKSAEDAKVITELRSALKAEAAAHREDSKTWEREFNRLLRDYETSGRQIERLEATILRQRQTAKERVAGRRNTEMRHKIQKKVNELDQLLRHGSKHRNVPEFLQDSVAAVLQAINMEVRDGDQRRKTFEATLARYDRQIAMTSDPDKVSELIRKRNEYEAKGDQFFNRMEMLQAAYKQIREENTGMELDEGIAGKLDSLFEVVGNTPLGQMNAAQLEAVNDILNVTQATIRNANELLAEERSAGVVENSKDAIREIRSMGDTKKKKTRIRKDLEKFGWNNLKPTYVFDVIGSKTLTNLYNALRGGEDTLATDLHEAKSFFREQWKKNGGKEWDMDQKWKFTSTSGKKFELDLNQIMTLYAMAKDEDARSHLRVGGFSFDSDYQTEENVNIGKVSIPIKMESADASAYNLSDEILGEIISKLTPQQRAFADAMQAYLSDVMAAKGNEVSLKKYGIRLFKKKNYFPIRVADQFMAKAREQRNGDRKLKDSGFTKERKPKATNPVVLSAFTEIWAEHVDEMSLYHSFVLPLDDFNRVLNYHDMFVEGQDAVSVVEAITNAFGKGATDYIDQLIKDVNGGIRGGSTVSFANSQVSKAKKAQTMASLSVAIQQPSSIIRAMSMIDSRYFIGPKVTERTHDRTWDEIKQYAPIAYIKEMGGYDTNVGKSTVDYLTDTADYETFGEKFGAMFTDSKFRDDALGRLPALMDEMSWGVIWNAVKREQSAQHPNMDVNSKAFMNMVADRFTDVITRTQVYDSVFSRSGLMRDKNDLAKVITSFMAEPTTTANMLAVAVLQAKRGDISKAEAVKTTAAIVASLALNAALVSTVYALRDDDEDKRYDEKWMENFRNNFFESLKPAGYIPYVRDIFNVLEKGYDVERADMELFGDLQNAIDGLDNEDISAWDKTSAVIGAIGNLLGVPVKNILRDVKGIVQTAGFAWDDKPNPRTKTGAYMARRGMDLNNGEEMILALQRGDMEHIQRVFGRYESQEKAESALQSAIGEKYRAGEMGAEEATQLLTDYFDREEYEVYWLLDKWDYAAEHGNSDGYTKMGAYLDAIESGDYATEMQRYLEHGSEMSDFSSAISGRYKKQYLEADEAGREAIREKLTPAYLETGLYQSEVDKKFKEWDFEAEYDYTFSAYKAAYRDGEITEQDLRGAMKFYGLRNYEIDDSIRDLKEDIAFRKKYDMTLSEMKDAYDNGDVAKNTMKNALVYSGMTATEAQDWIKKRDISNRLGIDYMELDDAYKAGDITRQQLYNSMIEAGSTRLEADEAIAGYDWLKKNYKRYPDLTISDAKKFVIKIGNNDEDHTLADYGVTIDHYIQYAKLKPECKGVDANGDGKTDDGTLRDSIFLMIDSLPISDQEKDGLALISYGIKSIRKNAPWHKK